MDNSQNIVYVSVLIETLKKKKDVLALLREETQRQGAILSEDSFDEEAFNKTISKKASLLEELEKLDTGFDDIYAHVSEELSASRQLYKAEILRLQELIKDITASGVELQSLEEQNKNRIKIVLGTGKKKIKDFRISSKTAAAYYRNMSNQHQAEQSYFMDRKK